MSTSDSIRPSSPPRSADPLEHAIADVSHLRPDLAACGFSLGDIELELSASPAVVVNIHRTHGDAQHLTTLIERPELTSTQRGLVGAMQRAFEMDGMIQRTGHRMGAVRIKVGLPPVVTIALTRSGEPTALGESAPPTAPDAGPTMPEAQPVGPTLLADASPPAPPPPSVRPPPPPPPRAARLSDKAPPPPKSGVATQLGYPLHASGNVAPPRPAAARPSTPPSPAGHASVRPPPPRPSRPAAPIAAPETPPLPPPQAQQAMPAVAPQPQAMPAVAPQPQAMPAVAPQPQAMPAVAPQPQAMPAVAEPQAMPAPQAQQAMPAAAPALAQQPPVGAPANRSSRVAPTQHDGFEAAPDPALAPPQPAGPVAQEAPMQAALAPGSWVYVTWTDGNRYPGKVVNAASGQLLIEFEDGAQHWVHESYVAPV